MMVAEVPISRLAMKPGNVIYPDQVARYVAEFPEDYPIEIYADVAGKRRVRFFDEHPSREGELYFVVDNGHHRVLAAITRGWSTILA